MLGPGANGKSTFLRAIIEVLGDYSSRTKDLEVLTEYVRNALARTICKQYVDDRDRLGSWVEPLDEHRPRGCR